MSRQAACACLTLAACLALPQASAQLSSTPSALPTSKPSQASLDDYRTHLHSLNTIVEACAKDRDVKSCDPADVGADDQVPVSPAPNAERRLVRYGWLRVLLSKAREKTSRRPSRNLPREPRNRGKTCAPFPPAPRSS